jgi:ribosomal protein L11 methyltransferase
MAWHQLSITTERKIAPQISDLFTTLGAVSVTYMDAEDQPVYEPKPGETRIWDATQVIALFKIAVEPELVKTVLFSNFPESALLNWHQERLEDQVWERSWMKYYKPMKFGKRIWVCPTGQEKSELGTVCMTLDPGLAFGTGTHPTTSLCLDWLSENEIQGKTVIDYGCGSGILAVAAALLGAKSIVAIDIDPQALTATQDNARKNSVQHLIQTSTPEDFSPILADIILANILAKPLMDLTEQLANRVTENGHLILSGILKEQAESVMNKYQNFFSMDTPIYREDWCRLSGIKRLQRP